MSDNKKMYAVVGNFGFHPNPKGIQVYSYDPATANMELVYTGFDEVRGGHISVDKERKVIYLVNEWPDQRGQTGGGGYLLALKVDPETGNLKLIDEKPTLSAEPCYTYLDKSKRYFVVSHHADKSHVTKIVRTSQGFTSMSVFDDAGLVLFRLNDDGTIGEVADIALTPGNTSVPPHTNSHHHSVLPDPSGEMLIICDKGLDKFHTFRLDRDNGKLVQLLDTIVETGLVPRYGAFHPTLPIFYANFECKTILRSYHYDVGTGKLDELSSIPLLRDEKVAEGIDKVEAADILMHPSGKYLYIGIRGVNLIAVIDIAGDGTVSLRENIDCGGNNPRSLCLSPDNRFLFTTNVDSGNVAAFSVGEDGSLTPTGMGAKARCPGTMRIIEA